MGQQIKESISWRCFWFSIRGSKQTIEYEKKNEYESTEVKFLYPIQGIQPLKFSYLGCLSVSLSVSLSAFDSVMK